ncbi:hypothetical protein ACE21V_002110 [Salmonella enterica]
MVFEEVNGEEMINEISALSRRTAKMKICGFAVGAIGLLAAISGIVGFLCSLFIGPSATDFQIDIPAALIPIQNGGQGSFGSIADVVGESMAGIGSIIVGTAGALALVYTPFKVMREGISLNSLLPLFSVFIFFSAFKLLPELIDAGKDVGLEATNTISETSKVTEYLNNDETEKLLDYLRSVNSGIPDKIPLINYVAAQASIKDGKVDIPLTKSVVDTYQAGTSFTDIPGNVRYALEMAAFSKAVTPDAVSYEDNKNALVRQYSNLGKSSFFAGGILALTGLLILSCVRRLNQRVKFLNSFAYK